MQREIVLNSTVEPNVFRAPSGATAINGSHVVFGSLANGAVYVASNLLASETYLNMIRGGTGVGSFTQYGVIYGNGTGALQVTAAGTTGQVLMGNTGSAPTWGAYSAIDHGALGGLGDDDHAQYALLAGRSGGQILRGGTAVTDSLTLRATAGVGTTGSNIIFQVGNNGGTEAMRIDHLGNVGIGTNAPDHPLHIATTTGLRIGTSSKYFDFFTSGSINDINSSENITFNFSNGKHLLVGAGGTSRIGINTLTPSAPLHVNNSGGVRIGTDAKYIDLFTYGGGNDLNSSDDLYINFNNNKHVLIGFGGTSNLNVSGVTTSANFVSTVATGTAPFAPTSTTLNTNLNADLLDGLHATSFSNIKQNISLTGQVATIGTTAITGTNTAGLYRCSYYLEDTTADVTAGTIMVNFAYTDEAGATTLSSVALALTALGRTQGSFFIRVSGTGSISYSTTLVGLFGTSVYALFITSEKLL